LKLKARVRVELIDEEGRIVVDETTGMLLKLIEKCGSILCASRSLGIAYSRAWERISRLERLLGRRIVEARRGGRGGGGAKLTEAGREILSAFIRAYRRVHGHEPQAQLAPEAGGAGALVYAGSNDPALQRLIGLARQRGVPLEAYWLGSLRGLAAVLLGEADIAGVHVPNVDGKDYNTGLLQVAGMGTSLVLVRGYMRLQGFITSRRLSYREIVEGLLSGRLRLVNREEGSGTRILLERILRREAEKLGVAEPLDRLVKGWDDTVNTHLEVAERIARGEADVGLGVECAARLYGLHFTPVTWERFDFITAQRSLEDGLVKNFLETLCSAEFKELISTMPGYKTPSDMCSVVRS
jgi:putative molybdopterin biosynthesis protein